jgi:hypothetical protein
MRVHLLLPVLVLGALPAAAGGIFYNSNQSAEYIRSFDRNSAIDNGDIVYYNMAGTPRLRDGWTLNFSDQMIFQWATVTTLDNPVVGNHEYKSDNPALIVPNFYAAYKKDNWAGFLGVETIGATAIREWGGGLPTLDLMGKQMAGYGSTGNSTIIGANAYGSALNSGASTTQAQAAAVAAALGSAYYPSHSYLKGSSYYIALRGGGAIQFTPKFSMAMAARIVTSQQSIVGSVDAACTYDQDGNNLSLTRRAAADVVDKAVGASAEIGFNYDPTPEMVINLTYEMATKLNFHRSVKDGESMNGLFVDGQHNRLDLPQVVRFGFGYQVTPALRLSGGANDYLESKVNFGMLNDPAFNINASAAYRNTIEESLSAEYRLNPKWLVSFGLNLNQIGQNKAATVDISVPGAHADYFSQGIGFQYAWSERTRLNFGLAHTGFVHCYKNADAGDQQVQAAYQAEGVSIDPSKEYNKEYLIAAFGIDFHF